ncbi:MAG: lantibiotic dehydratase [Pseudonocardiaceae bacterium]
MHTVGRKPLYRHGGVALLRAAAAPLSDVPGRWPDPSDTEACRVWLHQVWSRPDLVDAIRQASPGLADRIDAIRADRTVRAKQVRRATVATVRYLLRATGRHTPFGLFAGVAPVSVGPAAQARWGAGHWPMFRIDTQWLADVIERLEVYPDLLERLDVVFTNLATQRGGRLEAPHGPNRVSIRYTSAVHVVRDASASPIRFGALADKLAETFPEAGQSTVCGMLTDLVQQGFLITCLRAPLTVTDPLDHLVDRLREAGADAVAPVASLLRDLEVIRAEVHRHNQESTIGAGQARSRASITRQMRELSHAGRTPLAVDLRLDCDVRLPVHVAHEMEWAASTLVRLTRQPTGEAPWRDFYTAFCERYGTGTLVPLADVVDPDAGLGFPAGYPGSVLPSPSGDPSERDETLLVLAWQAVADGSREITLVEETIQALTVGDPFTERSISPHVELAARIHATSTQALERGEYTLTVAPARSAGTLTSRFTTIATGSGLEKVYRAVPVATEGALPVQLSFPPVYPHAENVCRVPAYLPHVLSLGEHRGYDEATVALDDLAVTATRDCLYLVSISRQRVIEPQVFHALALDKQPPPLARFLAHLSRALGAAWHEFDWGPHAQRLPFLPRVRYRRAILSPARWRLTANDLPPDEAGQDRWHQALDRWRSRWQCPDTVELRDADRSLRLTPDEPAHAAILHAHVKRHGHATFIEAAAGVADFGWIDGHAHEIALPLATMRPAAPSPLAAPRPVLTNSGHGQLPGSPDAAWLYAKIHTHPELLDEIIGERLPALLATLEGEPLFWFVRYRSPHETDHLRLRIRTPDREHYGRCMAAVGTWAQRLRHDGVAGRLVFDTYHPETGRYGHGAAMDTAEEVFAADSRVVSVQLRHLAASVIDPSALAALNMVGTVHGFLGSLTSTMEWLAARPAPAGTAVDRTVADQVVRLARSTMLRNLPGWEGEVAEGWQARAAALASYRTQLSADADTGAVLESLLHMHHNRALGLDRDGEKICRRLARQAALAWTAQRGGNDR